MASARTWTTGKRKVGSLLLLVTFALAAGLTSCGDGSDPTEVEDDPREDAIVAFPDLTVTNSVGAAAASGSLASAAPGVTYVSAPPGTFTNARDVTITNPANGDSHMVAVEAGGFDPVALEAEPADTLDFLVRHRDGSTGEYFTIVPTRKRPRVVRTLPQKGATDVVLSVTVMVVFSEPIDGSTSTTDNVQLRSNGEPVDGTLILSEDGLRATFTPAALLQPATAYTLAITTAVLDLEGDALEEEVLATFTAASGLDAGFRHTCLTRGDGTPYCWGANGAGRLGRPASEWELPGRMLTELVFESLSLGTAHSCGVTPDAVGYCWGANGAGQLGDGTTTGHESPTAVIGEHSFVALSAGAYHTCGLTANGAAYCWGYNLDGELGDGTTTNRDDSRPVWGGGRSFVSIAAGDYHTCGLTASGDAYCWGGNWNGQLGAQSFETCAGWACSTAPLLVSGGHEFVALAVGVAHTCGLTAGGEGYCWGANEAGQFGNGVISGASEAFYTPVAVEGGHAFVSIVAASSYTCGLTGDGQAYCWGLNMSLQLGIGENTGLVPTPTPVVGGHQFQALAAGQYHACAQTTAGEMYCWGANGYGQLARDPETLGGSDTPLHVPLP